MTAEPSLPPTPPLRPRRLVRLGQVGEELNAGGLQVYALVRDGSLAATRTPHGASASRAGW